MTRAVIVSLLFLTIACSDSKETRLQRFLLQGNDQVIKGNDGQAIGYYRAALKLDSCFADAWNNLGTVFYRQENFDEALKSYDRAITCRPGYAEALMNRANTYYELKQFYSALQDLDKVSDKAPDTAELHFSRGLIYTQLRDYEKATDSFQRKMKKDPNNPEVMVNRGTVYYYRQKFDSARSALNLAIKLDSTQANANNTAALLEVKQGNYSQGMANIDRALRLKPNDPYFLNNRGYIWLVQGEFQKA